LASNSASLGLRSVCRSKDLHRLARTFAAGNTDARSALARIEDIITVVEDDNPTTTVTAVAGKVAYTR